MSKQTPIPFRCFADRLGISVRELECLCAEGRILGARVHPFSRKWCIYPPAKLVLSRGLSDFRGQSHD
jgi:hypothetical protein